MSKKTAEILGYIHITVAAIAMGLFVLFSSGLVSKHDIDAAAPMIISCCLANMTLFFYGMAHRPLD